MSNTLLEANQNEIFLNKICFIKDNDLYIDYQNFKYFANESTYDTITIFVINSLKKILKTKELFTIHLSMKALTMTEIDKHYNYIAKICTLFKKDFPEKLEICNVYNAPFIFSQLFNIIYIFIDKNTQNKIKIIE